MINGVAGNPVLFTSQSGLTGDWTGIHYGDASDDVPNKAPIASYMVVENAGQPHNFLLPANDNGGSFSPNSGIAVYNPTVKNNITFNNVTVTKSTGDGIRSYKGNPQLYNSIVAFNTGTGLNANGAGSNASLWNSDSYGNGGAGNINNWQGALTQSDPLFVDFANGDYHLQAGSPCIDTGILTGLPFFGVAPDMGAFEQ